MPTYPQLSAQGLREIHKHCKETRHIATEHRLQRLRYAFLTLQQTDLALLLYGYKSNSVYALTTQPSVRFDGKLRL